MDKVPKDSWSVLAQGWCLTEERGRRTDGELAAMDEVLLVPGQTVFSRKTMKY